MNEFLIGEKVMCINNLRFKGNTGSPYDVKIGETYTVQSVSYGYDFVKLHFKEIKGGFDSQMFLSLIEEELTDET